jgi:uncharacterized membrane protein required for colicin V production
MNALPSINWMDVVIVLMLIGAMLVGFGQGALRQLFGLASLYISLVVASLFNPVLGLAIMQVQTNMVPAVAQVIAFFILLFVVGLVFSFLIYDLMRRRMQKPIMMPSRVVGGILGLFVGAIFVAISLIALNYMTINPWPGSMENLRQGLVSSRTASIAAPVFKQAFPYLVQSIRPWLPNLPPLFIDIPL